MVLNGVSPLFAKAFTGHKSNQVPGEIRLRRYLLPGGRVIRGKLENQFCHIKNSLVLLPSLSSSLSSPLSSLSLFLPLFLSRPLSPSPSVIYLCLLSPLSISLSLSLFFHSLSIPLHSLFPSVCLSLSPSLPFSTFSVYLLSAFSLPSPPSPCVCESVSLSETLHQYWNGVEWTP